MLNDIIKNIQGSILTAQILHWETRSFAQHEALGSYITNIQETLDEFVESYISHNLDTLIQVDVVEVSKDITSFTSLRKYLIDNRDQVCHTADMDSLMDNILAVLNALIYKLNRLS